MIYQFAHHDRIKPPEEYMNLEKYKLHERLANGDKNLTREEKDRLVFTASDPVHKFMGYAYDFREFLNTYWVKTTHYGIQEYYALDKTAIRNHNKGMGDPIIKIAKIVDGNEIEEIEESE